MSELNVSLVVAPLAASLVVAPLSVTVAMPGPQGGVQALPIGSTDVLDSASTFSPGGLLSSALVQISENLDDKLDLDEVSSTASAGRIPRANSAGKIDARWSPQNLGANTSVPGGNTVANTTAETTLSSSALLAAGSTAAGDVTEFNLSGTLGTTGTPTLRIRAYAGSTLIGDTGAVTQVTITAGSGWAAKFSLLHFSAGASAMWECGGIIQTWRTAVGATVAFMPSQSFTVNSLNAQVITFTVTWGTASASNTFTLRQLVPVRFPA